MNQYEINLDFWKDKKICIIGGTGSLGQEIVRLLYPHNKNIRVFSRDESKHNFMRRDFPEINYFQGDISDIESLREGIEGYGYIFHIAANKDVVSCETNPGYTVKINILGAQNLQRLSKYKKILFSSTDKAENPVSLYGCTKFIAEYFLKDHVITRAGNIFGSRRSNVELWDKQYAKGDYLTVTDLSMTRFYISQERIARFTLWAATQSSGIYYPEMLSCSNAEIIRGRYPNAKIKLIGSQPGERMHEYVNGELSNNPQFITDYEALIKNL